MKYFSIKEALILKSEKLLKQLKEFLYNKIKVEKQILKIQKELDDLNNRILDLDVKASRESD